jgi:hypothetical protein
MGRSGWTAVAVLALVAMVSGCGSPAATSSPGGFTPSTSPIASGSASPSAVPPSPTPPGGPVPAGFTPASVTFVSLQVGWVLGSAPCPAGTCLTLLRTADSGHTWSAVPAPPSSLAASPDPGNHGVLGVRFAGQQDGWAFGPELWSTHDGGAHWRRVTIPGASSTAAVVDLATAAGAVHAAVFDGAVRIADSQVGADAWTLSSTSIPFGAGPDPRAQLVIQSGGGWLIEVDRTVVGGARFTGGGWTAWTPPCLHSAGDTVLAAATSTDLLAVCNEGIYSSGALVTHAYRSSDGGANFAQTGTVPVNHADAVAGPAPALAVVAARAGNGVNQLLRSADGGGSWSVVYQDSAQRQGSELGFTSADQGVVIEHGSASVMLMTFDGGQHWSQVAFG